MATPKEIPGFYYDTAKRRYFKIQPDHKIPQGAAHSRSAIAASKAAAERDEVHVARQRRERLGRIKRVESSTYSSLNLEVRNGGHSSKDLLARHYAASLCFQHRSANPEIFIEAITLNDGYLYCVDSTRTSGDVRFTNLSPSRRVDSAPSSEVFRMAHTSSRRPRVGLVELAGSNIGAYVQNSGFFALANGQVADLCRGLGENIWDIATPPDFHRPVVAMATDAGLWIGDFVADPAQGEYVWSRKGRPTDELMTVAFQDAHIVMSGQRSGRILFSDTRAPRSVYRIQHSSAVSGIATAKTLNHIMVNGLQTAAMYDLRYTKAIDNVRSKRSKKHVQNEKNAPVSAPFVCFAVPKDRTSTHYGRAKPLAYLQSHDIAVVSNVRGSVLGNPAENRVTLYQASTGRVLPSPLNSYMFSSPQIIAVGRVRAGPESIFVATDKELFEWNVDLSMRNENLDGDAIFASSRKLGPGIPDENTIALGSKPFPYNSRPDIVKLWDAGNNGPYQAA